MLSSPGPPRRRSAGALPSAACHDKLRLPPSSELKITRFPSGVHSGRQFAVPAVVSRVSVREPKSYTETWLSLVASTVTARRLPSGERRGQPLAVDGYRADASPAGAATEAREEDPPPVRRHSRPAVAHRPSAVGCDRVQ